MKTMKSVRLLVPLLLLAMLLPLMASAVTVRASTVTTEWSMNDGTLHIETGKTAGAGGGDTLDVSVSSYGAGWQTITANPHGYSWCGSDFRLERYVYVEGCEVSTYTVRDNAYAYWPAYTEYGAYLNVEDGEGILYQNYYNTYSYAGMTTEITASCDYLMWAGEAGSIGGSWELSLGAEGSSYGNLGYSMTDRAEHNGWRLAYGEFHFDGDPVNCGFYVTGTSLLDFSAGWDADDISGGVDMNVAGGSYSQGFIANFAQFGGTIDGLK